MVLETLPHALPSNHVGGAPGRGARLDLEHQGMPARADGYRPGRLAALWQQPCPCARQVQPGDKLGTPSLPIRSLHVATHVERAAHGAVRAAFLPFPPPLPSPPYRPSPLPSPSPFLPPPLWGLRLPGSAYKKSASSTMWFPTSAAAP